MVAKQTVYTIGPTDLQLVDMWHNSEFYKNTLVPNDADIFCFQGGDDVHPKLYGENVLEGTYFDDARDEEDIHYFTKYQGKPMVGICRGGQFLNVMAGGELYQDVNNHNEPHENINLLDIPGSVYKFGYTIDMTSVHHQMMIPSELGETFLVAHKATRFTSDDPDRDLPQYDVEAVWYEHLNAFCFQPHPEYNSKLGTRAYFMACMRYFYG